MLTSQVTELSTFKCEVISGHMFLTNFSAITAGDQVRIKVFAKPPAVATTSTISYDTFYDAARTKKLETVVGPTLSLTFEDLTRAKVPSQAKHVRSALENVRCEIRFRYTSHIDLAADLPYADNYLSIEPNVAF